MATRQVGRLGSGKEDGKGVAGELGCDVRVARSAAPPRQTWEAHKGPTCRPLASWRWQMLESVPFWLAGGADCWAERRGRLLAARLPAEPPGRGRRH